MERINYFQNVSGGQAINRYTDFKKERWLFKRDRFRKGQKVLYDGIEAEIINVKPLLIIKASNRVICGALDSKLECV